MAEDASAQLPTSLAPVHKPLSLIPVGLKEAALDSPTFRASSLHFGEQLDLVESWLQNYIRSAGRLSNEMTGLESLISTYVSYINPPAFLSDSIIDHDYTALACKRYSEGVREFWTSTLKWMKKVESTVLDPIKGFVANDLTNMRILRRNLDRTQREFDSLLARFAGQSKTKEASSLREDAFQLHEARRAYLKASMDFCTAAPQIKSALDKLLVKVFADRWRDMKNSREALANSFSKWSTDMDRIRGWSKEMEGSERVFREELQVARKQLEETAETACRPSRDIDDYAMSTVPYIGSTAQSVGSPQTAGNFDKSEKQGWLFQRGTTGKPARTVWNRRWFYVKNGIFGWLLQSQRGVEESEKTGVLLCGIRPMFQEERRFCFEVKTNLTSFVLQADTQKDLMEWISAFENAKRKALENPASSDAVAAGAKSIDPAFAVTPPISPEFAVNTVEAQATLDESSLDRAMMSNPDLPSTGSLVSRASIDVVGRTPIGTGPERDSTSARIIQKLDLHRKSNASATVSTFNSSPGTGGIASLISASHGSFALGAAAAAAPSTGSTPVTAASDFRVLLNSNIPTSSLAPPTLAAPPAPTNLSKMAVIINGDKGFGTGMTSSDDGGTPGGLLANLWGTNNWSYLNQLETGETPLQSGKDLESLPSVSPGLPRDPETMSLDGTADTGAIDTTAGSVDMNAERKTHRKTVSLSMEPGTKIQRSLPVFEYPSNYPLSLKAQDAQFRMLIPQKSVQDHLVLVFRAAWSANDQQEFPGRIYVTMNDFYFYSNHMGLVLISSVRLSSVEEITAAPGKDCDFVFIHLKEAARRDGALRLTVKVFLEPLKLLQRRLNYLVRHASQGRQTDLEDIIKTLLKMDGEKHHGDESPSLDSWEDVDVNTLSDVRGTRDIRTGLRIDGTLYPDANRAKQVRQATKFRLPPHPVEFMPQGFDRAVVEKEFNVTAKALFHILVGDKSAVFQILYCESCAERLVQSPWTASESGLQVREFRFSVSEEHGSEEVSDYQIIDVLNDHLCYVITDRKAPWYLPHAKDFSLLSKIVITHVAKSKCKLAIFTKVDWTKEPAVGKGLIDSQALHDLHYSALALAEVLSDQVSRLGIHDNSNSRKALQIYGKIGEQKTVAQLNASDLPPVRVKHVRKLKYRSLTSLATGSARRTALNASMTALGFFFQMGKVGFEAVTANRLIVLALIMSVFTNLFFTNREGWTWWSERRATKYMARMGVTPNPVMGRSVWTRDLEDWTNSTVGVWSVPQSANGGSACASQFGQLLAQTDPSFSMLALDGMDTTPSTRSTISRLQRLRHRYGTYRHDLLVALGVVQRMEEETVRAEYESWVFGEAGRCRAMNKLLSKQGKKRNATSEVEDLRVGLNDYCGSCVAEINRLKAA